LLAAFRSRDVERARALMLTHMRSAEQFNIELQGQLEQRMLVSD